MVMADVLEVAQLEKLAFALPWSWLAFEHELRHNPMAHFLVLHRWTDSPEEGGNPALLGYGGFWHIVDEAHICTLAVHPDWRRRGLGELLLARLIERASEVEAAVAALEVRASNVVAQRLYTKYGFVQVGQHKGYYSDTGEDALIMATERISSASFQHRLQELKALLGKKLAAREQDLARLSQHCSPGQD
jgi:ribosomal-protein-alanine N-acetyltransferase